MSVLVVSDLDGTLLHNNERASQKTIEVLNRLFADGLQFTVATARSWLTAARTINGLQLSLPVVIYNGTALVDPKSGKTIRVNYFPPDVREQIASVLQENHVSPIVYAFINGREQFSFLQDQITPGMRMFLDARRKDPRLRPVKNRQELLEGDVFYFNCINDRRKTEPLVPEFEKICHTIFAKDYYSDCFWLELMPFDVSKANGIQQVRAMYPFDRLVVFGDGKNDLEMFRIADEKYAPENADKLLKAAATAVISDNESDGVADFLAANRNSWLSL